MRQHSDLVRSEKDVPIGLTLLAGTGGHLRVALFSIITATQTGAVLG